MEGNKLELADKKPVDDPPATYKAIPETDMEEEAVTRPKSLVKANAASPEKDGADEKMLPEGDGKEKAEVKSAAVDEKQNGDAKLDIGEIRSAFVGLTKEELMKYANDPFWVRLRWFLFISFWVLWSLMLLGAILIIVGAPKCNPPPPRTWWEKGPLAELDSSFQPQDIKALKDKGLTGVIIPLLEDAYISLDETHDFIKSLKTYKDEELNVIVELEPGNSQIWFEKSETNDTNFGNYYIWKKPKSTSSGTPEPPNNWLRVDNNSSWIYSAKRKEFYYAPRGKPHLNFRNPNVTQEFSNVLKKFMDYGVAGIRLRGVPLLFVDKSFAAEDVDNSNPDKGLFHTDYGFYTHTKTENLKEIGPLLKEWSIIVKNKTENAPFMVAEDIARIESYKVNNLLVVDLPTVQSHLFTKANPSVANIVKALESTFVYSNITWPGWKLNSTDALEAVTYLLPGTPIINQDTPVNKDLMKIRDSSSIMRGIFEFHSLHNDTVFAFIRIAAGNPGILVAYNSGENRVVVDFPSKIGAVSEMVTVQYFSSNYNEPGVALNLKKEARSIPISPNSAIVLTYVPKTGD